VATRKQKKELMAALRFTPRDISIMLSGYGGEIAIGRISEAAYDFWKDRDDLSDFAYDWDNEIDVPADARIFEEGCWYDCDDICHENGVELGSPCCVTVTDTQDSQELWECELEPSILIGQGVTVERSGEADFGDAEYGFIGQSIEKGVFFDGTVRITRPFDPSLLKITYYDCDGWRLVTGVEYDGEEVEGFDAYSTNGKGSEFKVFEVTRDDDEDEEESDNPYNIGVLEGEEIWASKAIDDAVEVERWEGHDLSPWWPSTNRPQREGRYQVLLGDWPFPSFAEYSRRQGWRDGDEKLDNVVSWRGLSQPAE
jgi:hypothetical protein